MRDHIQAAKRSRTRRPPKPTILEGIASKRTDLPYRSGRCIHWHKVKTATWTAADADRGEKFKQSK